MRGRWVASPASGGVYDLSYDSRPVAYDLDPEEVMAKVRREGATEVTIEDDTGYPEIHLVPR